MIRTPPSSQIWRGMLLQFFNLVLHWNTVLAAWKINTVIPIKHGDPASPDQYNTIFLTSCAFKIFQAPHPHPHISERFNEGQGGFRWGVGLQPRRPSSPQGDIRTGSDVSHPWVDSGIAQNRVLSPMLFNLSVSSLAATISEGVRLISCSDFKLSNQLSADDLVIQEAILAQAILAQACSNFSLLSRDWQDLVFALFQVDF